jgi:hypothetical protein
MCRYWSFFNDEVYTTYLISHYLQGMYLMLWYKIYYPIWVSIVFEISIATWVSLVVEKLELVLHQ